VSAVEKRPLEKHLSKNLKTVEKHAYKKRP
jgi:hypothetical protein